MAKNMIVLLELLVMLLLSSILVYFVGINILGEKVVLHQLILATICLFIGTLPIIAISFLLYRITNKKFVVILINFVLSFPSAIIATTNSWMFFPWAYNLRILSPVVGVHPNGTFLEVNSNLSNVGTTYFGLVISLAVYLGICYISMLIERKKRSV